MNKCILVINSGSSSIKFSLFRGGKPHLDLFYHGQIENLYQAPQIHIFNAKQDLVLNQSVGFKGHEAGLKRLFDWLDDLKNSMLLEAVGHRVVHGGAFFFQPIVVTQMVMTQIASLIPLAPLHQPHNLAAIQIIHRLYPNLTQVACFDTIFHQTQDKLATLFAIPRSLSDEGIRRYGFHGISYEYIASVITQRIGEAGKQRVIMAHLGNGASMCAMYQGKSVATSMGFTALDGLMMGTRCGRIDPGVLLYLLEQKGFTQKQLEHMLYNESGLLGVSELSHDVRELLDHLDDEKVSEAIDLFCYRAALEAGSLWVALGGCDALIFTAGIGENSPLVRKKITEHFSWLGMKLDEEANHHHATIVSEKNSTVLVGVIPTNEEWMIAQQTCLKLIP